MTQLRPRDFHTIGPREGERLPDIRLPDQSGAAVDLHATRKDRRALVVFHRSAEWWPFCKTQLVQLQHVLPDLEAHGIALFAISYDLVEILGGFADKHGIRFPLLSDEGSRVIRRLGLINEHVQEDHAVYGIKPNSRHVDLPYPGVFVLDEAGVIVQKRFHASYRERDTGGALLATALGILESGASPSAASTGEAVAVRAWLDSPTYSFFQRLHVHVEIRVAPGFHVYGAPTPDGMVALSARVAPIDGLEVGPASWPTPHTGRLAGLGEEVGLHEGTIHGSLPLTFAAAPGAGDHNVKIEITYQACNDALCLPPSTIELTLPVTEVALVDRTLPTESKRA